MRPFIYKPARDAGDAVALGASQAEAHVRAPIQFLAGGTTLIDLMKIDVMQPTALVDLKRIQDPAMRRIEATDQGLRIGALVSMAEAADNAAIKRDYPVLSESLWMAASQQLRIMATLGGNVLQRTRCSYFRDTSYSACNKRNPGSGCAALDGFNRLHAVLGASDACIASYPGDWAQGLIALDAEVELLGRNGRRTIAFADLHRAYGETPHIETTLKPGELITAFTVPSGAHTRRSLYLKIRDREVIRIRAHLRGCRPRSRRRSRARCAHRSRRRRNETLESARSRGCASRAAAQRGHCCASGASGVPVRQT